MNLIFVMSLSGSIVFLIYLLMKPYSNRRLSARWQYNFLKICILFYLIPYQYFQDEYLKFYNRNFGSGEDYNPLRGDILVFNDWDTIYITPDGRLHYEYWLPLLALILLWLIIAAAFLFFHIRKYRSFRNKLLMLSEVPDEKTSDAAAGYRKTVLPKNKRQGRVLQCPFVKTPLAIGLFHPLIILPVQSDSKDLPLYLMHEQYHVQHHDALWKCIAFSAILLHWFNPLVYVLFLEVCSVSEKHCDEKVAESLNDTDKIYYASLMIKASRNQNDTPVLLADSFIKNKKQAKERILFMTRKSRKSTHWKLITALAVCLSILSMPMSVLAYHPFYTYHDTEYHSHVDVMYINPKGMSPLEVGLPTDLDFTLSDEIFTDESGNQYIITAEDKEAVRSCSHEYVKRTRNYHKKNGNSCTVYIYEGTYCKYCSHCLQETLISQTYYATCPH